MQLFLRLAEMIDRVSEGFARIVRWGLLANTIVIAGNAFSRKLFSAAWPSAFDLQWQFFAATVLLMAAYTLKRDEHVRLDILAHRFGERGLAWIDLFGLLLVLLPVCAAIVWISWPHFLQSFLVGESRATRESMSDIPAWIIRGFIPLGFFLLGLQGMAEAIRCVACLRGTISRPMHRRQLIEGGEHG